MKAEGKQLIAEFHGCSGEAIQRADAIEQALGEALNYAGLTFVKTVAHQFTPQGATVIAIISESHVSIHTFPEAGHVSIDIYTCTGGEKHQRLIDYLAKQFKPEKIEQLEVNRGVLLSLNEKAETAF